MKKAALFATILALAFGASAQNVTFGALPTALSPTALPKGHAGLDWSGFYYVAPSWSGGGDGFKQGPSALNVAFMGGKICELTEALCSASITSEAAANADGFQAQSAIVAAGYHAETVNVSVYNRGHFVGSHAYTLTTALQEIDFPVSWGAITQLVMETTHGTVVLYALNIRSVAAEAIGQHDAAGPTAVSRHVGATVPLRIIDPKKEAGADKDASGSPVQRVGPTAIGVLDPPPLASDGSVQPPILYSGPNAVRTASPDRGGVEPPIKYSGPNAIRTASPDGGGVEPPIKYSGPNAIRTASPDGGGVEPPIKYSGPNAVRTARPDRGGVEPPIKYSGPNAVHLASPGAGSSSE